MHARSSLPARLYASSHVHHPRAQVLPNTRLLKGLSEAAIEELAHRMCQKPVHTNDVVGLAKDEAALACGSVVAGLYIITRGRVQLRKQGKPLSATASSTLSSGQYFGEVALCTAHDQIATCDVVCSEYSEVYCLSKTALLEVADLYEGSLDILQVSVYSTLVFGYARVSDSQRTCIYIYTYIYIYVCICAVMS